jgi:radical SAM protein with 4Fe4S-binding SPASM domain
MNNISSIPAGNSGNRPLTAPLRPTIVTLELSTACDNRCSGCANSELVLQRSQKEDRRHMHRWKEMLQKLTKEKKNEPLILRLSGGEPTLHPEFESIVRYIDSLGIPHALLTTGRWQKIGAENLIKLYSSCKHAAGMLISLHGADAETHTAFTNTGKEAFLQTCHNIQLATAAGITVFTNTVITNKNFHQIEAIARLSQNSGAECAVFNRFIAQQHPLLPETDQLVTAIQQINNLKNRGANIRIGNSIPKCFYRGTSFPNVAGYELCHISPDGAVRPDNLSRVYFGNLFEQPLKNIWQSEPAWEYRTRFPQTCMQCAALPACRGSVKSLDFGNPKFPAGDPLMTRPLSLEEIADIDDDKDKRRLSVLALTSD